jgi:glutamate synthase domain-containing protein 2
MPIVLKGLQTHEDAYLAAQYVPQVKAIILSNHGGRALDTAPPAVHTLLEIRKYCPEVFSRIEVWVDGGIKRGTDVVKALCLGAKAVGVGRAALFGLGAGGVEGVERTFESKKPAHLVFGDHTYSISSPESRDRDLHEASRCRKDQRFGSKTCKAPISMLIMKY